MIRLIEVVYLSTKNTCFGQIRKIFFIPSKLFACWVILCFCCGLLIFFQNYFSATLSVTKSLDPDRDRLSVACWVILHAFVVVCLFFSKLLFSKNSYSSTVSVGPDLAPNCLQRLLADDKIETHTC